MQFISNSLVGLSVLIYNDVNLLYIYSTIYREW